MRSLAGGSSEDSGSPSTQHPRESLCAWAAAGGASLSLPALVTRVPFLAVVVVWGPFQRVHVIGFIHLNHRMTTMEKYPRVL